jgi:CheY-like chemotaxis protein
VQPVSDADPKPTVAVERQGPSPGQAPGIFAGLQRYQGSSGPRHRTVLVVDDDESIRQVVAAALQDEGYDVLQARHGAAALDQIDRKAVDLILLDMRMPVMNGWEFARAYGQRPGPHAPIVTMTAATDANRWSAEIGATGVLGKPFDIDDLLRAVEPLLSP